MLTAEQNERVTRVGPGTPCGALLRRYWQPAALVEELEGERPVKPVTLLGEHLVLFRDTEGRYGLIDRHCRHRGADLAFGRLERDGLRCPFHGWLYDTQGRCLEQPPEPPGSTFHRKVRQPAYPCEVRNGVVFAYLGEGAPPAMPAFDCFAAPDAYTFAFKGYYDCNWLQALEVGIDPAHASFLHRFFEDEDPEEGYGLQFRDQTGGIAVTRLLREYDCPRLEIEDTDYGLRVFALRDLDGERTHIRVTNLMFPNAFIIPMSADMNITQWHVPIDDETNYWYAVFTSFGSPVDKERMRAQRLESCTLPDYKPLRNRENNWGYDPTEQRSRTYTGMGMDINVHDQWAVESPGRIQDRTVEHLGTTDKGIIAYRKKLMRAIEANGNGGEPPFVLDEKAASRFRGPIAIDTIGPSATWQEAWRIHEAERRGRSAWAEPVLEPAP